MDLLCFACLTDADGTGSGDRAAVTLARGTALCESHARDEAARERRTVEGLRAFADRRQG